MSTHSQPIDEVVDTVLEGHPSWVCLQDKARNLAIKGLGFQEDGPAFVFSAVESAADGSMESGPHVVVGMSKKQEDVEAPVQVYVETIQNDDSSSLYRKSADAPTWAAGVREAENALDALER